MLSLSTSFVPSWKSWHANDLVQQLHRLHIHAVELEYRIPTARYTEIKRALTAADISITSVHNYFPFTATQAQQRPSGDLFNLADLDPEMRKLALSGTIRTIQHANDLETPVVILHCGWVEMDHQPQKVAQYLIQNQSQSQVPQKFSRQKLTQLEKMKSKHLSCLMFSLDRLLPIAEKQGVTLGLENRFHDYELPTPTDFAMIFREFQGAPLGYWHDLGHSHALETIGLIEPGFLLKHYAPHLIGLHIHDAIGLSDHMAPGKGEIDLSAVCKQLDKSMPLVLELKPGTTEADINFGIQHILPKLPQ